MRPCAIEQASRTAANSVLKASSAVLLASFSRVSSCRSSSTSCSTADLLANNSIQSAILSRASTSSACVMLSDSCSCVARDSAIRRAPLWSCSFRLRSSCLALLSCCVFCDWSFKSVNCCRCDSISSCAASRARASASICCCCRSRDSLRITSVVSCATASSVAKTLFAC